MAEHQLGREIPPRDIRRIIAFLKTLPGEYRGRPLIARGDEEPAATKPEGSVE